MITENELDVIPILVEVNSTQWAPPQGCKIISKIGNIYSCRIDNKSLEYIKTDPNVKRIAKG